MQLRYDENLVEAAVFLWARAQPGGPPAAQRFRFHREREKLYVILDPEERNAAFFKLHLDWFREWGLEKLLTQPAREFQLLSARLDVLAYRQAQRKNEEGAELYVNRAEERTGIIAIQPQTLRQKNFDGFLLHELAHLNDMLDPQFDYSPELLIPTVSMSQQRLARERYRLLWAISIDGRLTRANKPTVATETERRAEFGRVFGFWPEAKRTEVFDGLWNNPAPNHNRFRDLVGDTLRLQTCEGPRPGSPCPLCGFPTFIWAGGPELSRFVSMIQAEFADWTLPQGACSRCLATFRVRRQALLQPVVAQSLISL